MTAVQLLFLFWLLLYIFVSGQDSIVHVNVMA